VALALLAAMVPPARAGEPVAELRELMAARLALMADVARSKWSTGSPIDDPPREAALLAAGAAAAAAQQLEPVAVEALLRAQIEAAKLVQHRWFDVWTEATPAPFPDAAGLLAARRPEIARLSAALVPAWAAARAELADCAARARLSRPPPQLADDAQAWAVATAGATATLPACP
jgi:chorismate mutase